MTARDALERKAGLVAVAQWEKQHGSFTGAEMDEARRRVRAQLRSSRTSQRKRMRTQPVTTAIRHNAVILTSHRDDVERLARASSPEVAVVAV
jgi:hypothetical protein